MTEMWKKFAYEEDRKKMLHVLKKLRILFLKDENTSIVPFLLPRFNYSSIDFSQRKKGTNEKVRSGLVRVFKFPLLYDSFFSQLLCSDIIRRLSSAQKMFQNAVSIETNKLKALLIQLSLPLSKPALYFFLFDSEDDQTENLCEATFLIEEITYLVTSFYHRMHGKSEDSFEIEIPCFDCSKNFFPVQRVRHRKSKSENGDEKSKQVKCACKKSQNVSELLSGDSEIAHLQSEAKSNQFWKNKPKECRMLAQNLLSHHLHFSDFLFPLLFLLVPQNSSWTQQETKNWDSGTFNVYFLCEACSPEDEDVQWHCVNKENPLQLSNPSNLLSLCGEYCSFLWRIISSFCKDLEGVPGDHSQIAEHFTNKFHKKDKQIVPSIFEAEGFRATLLQSVGISEWKEIGLFQKYNFYSHRPQFVCQKHKEDKKLKIIKAEN